MICCFLIGVIIPIVAYLNDMFFGNINDASFSEKTLKRLTVKQDSFLRKIAPFKEKKGSVRPKYLYIRIIPLILHVLILLIIIPIFAIDQLLVNIMIDDVFGYIGIILAAVFVLYNFTLAILARVFKF